MSGCQECLEPADEKIVPSKLGDSAEKSNSGLAPVDMVPPSPVQLVAAGKTGPRMDRRWVTAALMLVMVLASMEQTVTSTAMPTIIGSLHGLEHYSWVASIYLLACTVSMPLYGRLADALGRKRVILFSIGLFALSSMLASTARTMPELIAYRGLQGLGAGGIMPVVLTILGDIFTLEERARIQGLFSAVWGTAALAGPAPDGNAGPAPDGNAGLAGHAGLETLRDPAAEAAVEALMRLVTEVRRFRSDQGLRPTQPVPAVLAGIEATPLAAHETRIRALLRLTAAGHDFTPTASVQAEGVTVRLDTAATIDVGAERRRLAKDLATAQAEVDSAQRKLSTPSFVERAPTPVVAKMRDRLAAAQAEITRIEGRLSALPPAAP